MSVWEISENSQAYQGNRRPRGKAECLCQRSGIKLILFLAQIKGVASNRLRLDGDFSRLLLSIARGIRLFIGFGTLWSGLIEVASGFPVEVVWPLLSMLDFYHQTNAKHIRSEMM